MTKAGYLGAIALGGLVAVTALAGTADAREHGGNGARGAGMLERLDTDGDGTVTRAEVDALRAARFAEADADGDGQLTLEEMTGFADAQREERAGRRMARAAERMIDRLDADENGTLDIEEATAAPMRLFDRLDADEDGAITKAEMDAVAGRMHERHGERQHKGRGSEGRRSEGRRSEDRRGEGHGERRHGEYREDAARAPWWMPVD